MKWVVSFWADSWGGEVEGGSERSLKEGGFCCQAGLLRRCTQRRVEFVCMYVLSMREQCQLTCTHYCQMTTLLDACSVTAQQLSTEDCSTASGLHRINC